MKRQDRDSSASRQTGRQVAEKHAERREFLIDRDAQGLENAHPADLSDAQISASGLGVHFPKIDADIYIPALLEGFLGSKRWMAAQMGKVGGKASTEEKASAARENGKRGGRPRKSEKLVVAAT